jgi:hypothetical protein
MKTRLEEPIEQFDNYQICENYRLKTSQNNNNKKIKPYIVVYGVEKTKINGSSKSVKTI